MPFLIRCCVYISAGLLAGCATPLEQGADWNAITKHGFRQITPLPMPDAQDSAAVTIPKFTFEGYDATVASAWNPAPYSVYAGRGDPAYLYVMMQYVPELGAVMIPIRRADGGSDNAIRLNPRRQAARLFRAGFESFTDSAPVLVMATRPDEDIQKPVPLSISIYLLQPSANHISFFTPVRAWTTSGHYCDPGSALNRIMGIAPRLHETVDGCSLEQ